MKQGKTLIELATELQRQAENKKDYIAPVEALQFVPGSSAGGDCPRPLLSMAGKSELMSMTDIFHSQMATELEIPKKYYDRMLVDSPELLNDNVNHWLAKGNNKRMIRTLDGKARAFLSDKYRPLDYADLAEAILPAVSSLGLHIMSCDITERRFYLKAVDMNILENVPTGHTMGDGTHTMFDTLSPGVVISNSEVGYGALSVDIAVYTRACTNLALFGAKTLRKYHIGQRNEMGDMYELLTDQTRRLSDAAVWSQVKDVVAGAFDPKKFKALTETLHAATEDKIEGDPIKVVEATAKHFQLNDGERNSVLKHLLMGGDLTRYGLHGAITRTAEDLTDYDRASEFERMGGQVIELPRNDWQSIALAA